MTTEKRSLSIEARVTDLATSAFTKMLGSARSFAGGAIPLFKATAVAFTAISAAAVGGFLVFRRYAEELDKLAKISDKFGVTAESLTAIRNGAELAGVGIDSLATAAKNFEKVVAEANEGGEKQRDTLRELGLTSEQFAGSQLDLVEVLAKVSDGLGGVQGAAARTKVLIDLFGKSGADLAPLLQGGSDAIRKMAADAGALGAVFTRDELARVEAFNDSWQELTQTFRALAERLVIDLSPAITDLFKTLNREFQENSGEIKRAFVDLLGVLVEGFDVLRKIFETLNLSIQGWKSLVLTLSYFTAEMIGNEEAAKILNKRLIEQNTYLNELVEGWQTMSPSIEQARLSLLKFRESGTGKGGGSSSVTVTAERAPEIVPPSAFERFSEGMEKARDQWTNFAQTAYESGNRLVGGTLDALTNSLAAGMARTQSWSQVWKAFGENVKGILTQVIAKLLVVRALSGLSSLFGGGQEPTSPGPSPQIGGEADVGFEISGAGGANKRIGALPRGGLPGPAAAPVVNLNFYSYDAKGSYELIRANRPAILQIVAEAMQRSNSFRGVVKEASV